MNDQPVREPIAEYVAEQIAEQFTYGSSISFDWLETHLREKRHTTKFAFGMITVCSRLKEAGFRLSQQGTHGQGYRILEKAEMQPYTEKQEKQKIAGTMKNHKMLAAVDTTDMPTNERTKHEYWTTKLAYLGACAEAIMRRKKLPPNVNPINPFQIK